MENPPNTADPSVPGGRLLYFLRSRIRSWMPWVVAACLFSLILEFTLTLSPRLIEVLHILDLFFLVFFATDLFLSWKFSPNSREFFKENWLNILALIPVIRALRFIRFSGLARFGRVARLARF